MMIVRVSAELRKNAKTEYVTKQWTTNGNETVAALMEQVTKAIGPKAEEVSISLQAVEPLPAQGG